MKRFSIALIAVLIIGLLGFSALAWRPALDPIARPAAATFPADIIAKGEILAGAGYCGTCHTVKGGPAYAGGYGLVTGFGTIYSTNITPDPETGIGTWSEAAFRRALHEGVSRDGSHLFPAFPYDHFTKLTDADVAALYAFFMTRPAVKAPARPNDMPFPLGIRALQAGWKLLFFKAGRFEPVAGQTAEWNRGAYLATGIDHCGACHTPRNDLGAERHDAEYAGAVIDGWVAPPLTEANPAPVKWDRDALVTYLSTGLSALHGVATGPMAPVVHGGLDRLPAADVQAIATYFAGPASPKPAATQATIDRALAADRPVATLDPGARLFAAACASCHYNGAAGPHPLRPDLGLVTAVQLGDPADLLRVTLGGIGADSGAPGIVMPAFDRFSDADIALIAGYLRASRTDKAPWPDLEKSVRTIRTAVTSSPKPGAM